MGPRPGSWPFTILQGRELSHIYQILLYAVPPVWGGHASIFPAPCCLEPSSDPDEVSATGYQCSVHRNLSAKNGVSIPMTDWFLDYCSDQDVFKNDVWIQATKKTGVWIQATKKTGVWIQATKKTGAWIQATKKTCLELSYQEDRSLESSDTEDGCLGSGDEGFSDTLPKTTTTCQDHHNCHSHSFRSREVVDWLQKRLNFRCRLRACSCRPKPGEKEGN